jgi:fumarate hydratase subunit beta
MFDKQRHISLPLAEEVIRSLVAGDLVSLTGVLYTGRDQTHRRLSALLEQGHPLPVDLQGQLLYYVGPSPARPGQVVGAAGPTTSYRMDAYTPKLIELGVRATMGKGARSPEVRRAMLEHGAIYLASIGGAGALLSKCVRASEVVAFEDAGPEALFRFEVKNFPAVVINDVQGRDFYELLRAGE